MENEISVKDIERGYVKERNEINLSDKNITVIPLQVFNSYSFVKILYSYNLEIIFDNILT